MTKSTVEVERKFDVEPSTPLPDLTAIDGVSRVGEPATHRLEAVYFDTKDLALASYGMTLRRRTGGPDAGWHLKLPKGPGRRTEIHAALGRPEIVPDDILARVLAYTRGHAVAPVATVNTSRTSIGLYAEDGRAIAEFVDDHVEAEVSFTDATSRTWREWELELNHNPGDDAAAALFDAAAGIIAKTGARPSERTSKLATALAGHLPRTKGSGREVPERKGRAVVPVLDYLDQQVARMLRRDAQVRMNADDSVHQLRSVTRRIRSVLHSYRKFFKAGPVDELEAGLKSLAQTLGRYRDAEVLHRRLRESLDELPGRLVLGPLAAELDERMKVRKDTALTAIRSRMDSPGYFRLLDQLEAFVEEPPVAPEVMPGAGKATAKRVNKAAKRLAERHDAAVAAAVGPSRDKAFHEVRKAAKKLRFAAAAAESIHGKQAAKIAHMAHRIQTILGEHQDSAVARTELLKLGSAPGMGNAAFTYGVLHARERTAADAVQQEYLRLGKKVRKLRIT
jgi:CHAD domain-containing protein